MQQLLLGYKVVFVCEEFPNIGLTNMVEYKIQLKEGAQPFTSRAYRLDPKKTKALRELLDKLLKEDIIEPAISPYSSPIILIRKPMQHKGEGEKPKVVWRFCP